MHVPAFEDSRTRWEPRKLLELVFKPFVYVIYIYAIKYVQTIVTV